MRFCVVKRNSDDYFFGRELDDGYYYSSWTNADPSIDESWNPVDFYLGHDRDRSCGFIIFESVEKATEYLEREWPITCQDIEYVLLDDLEDYYERS